MENKKESKKYYDVKIEAMVPAVFHYRVFAIDENEAAERVSEKDLINIQYNKTKKRNIVMKVYDYGTILLRLVKHFIK